MCDHWFLMRFHLRICRFFMPDNSNFNFLLELWFPADEELPMVVGPDNNKGIIWIDPWLKSRMIMSSIPRLVDKGRNVDS